MPYLVVVIIFGVANLYTPLVDWLKTTVVKFDMPLLSERLLKADGTAVDTVYKWAWLGNPDLLSSVE